MHETKCKRVTHSFRVLHLIETDRKAGRFLHSWMGFLRQHGVEVGLMGCLEEHLEEFKDVCDYLVPLPWAGPFSPVRETASLLDLYYVLSNWKPHILHSHDLISRLRGHIMGRRLDLPLLIHSRSDEAGLLERVTARISHYEVSTSGEHTAHRTVIPSGLPDGLIHQKMYSVYQNLWAARGAGLHRSFLRGPRRS